MPVSLYISGGYRCSALVICRGFGVLNEKTSVKKELFFSLFSTPL